MSVLGQLVHNAHHRLLPELYEAQVAKGRGLTFLRGVGFEHAAAGVGLAEAEVFVEGGPGPEDGGVFGGPELAEVRPVRVAVRAEGAGLRVEGDKGVDVELRGEGGGEVGVIEDALEDGFGGIVGDHYSRGAWGVEVDRGGTSRLAVSC